jgi:hypothetical protein
MSGVELLMIHSGNITMIGQILQLATILDNVGMYVPFPYIVAFV